MPGSTVQERSPRRVLPARGLLLLGAPLLVAGALAAVLLTPGAASTASPAPDGVSLPTTVTGLGLRRDVATAEVVDDLATRLRSDPQVAGVAVGAYAGPVDGAEVSLVVLRLVPREALDEATAGRLTAEVLGASGAERGMSDDFRSAASDDGEALVTCSSPTPTAATCVAVEASQALLVLVSGEVADPVDLAARVRDDVG